LRRSKRDEAAAPAAFQSVLPNNVNYILTLTFSFNAAQNLQIQNPVHVLKGKEKELRLLVPSTPPPQMQVTLNLLQDDVVLLLI
jgi:hypothetical protein